jgi:hypothetical protein
VERKQTRHPLLIANCFAAALSQACKAPATFQATELPPPANEAKESLRELNSHAMYISDRCMLRDVVIGQLRSKGSVC